MIDKLLEKNSRLSNEALELKIEEEIEFGRRWLTEEEIRRSQSNQQQLEDQVRCYAGETDYYKSIAARCFIGLDKPPPVLGDLRKDTSLDWTKIRTIW
jgi:hypothetical protein